MNIPDWFGFLLMGTYCFVSMAKFMRVGRGEHTVIEKPLINFADGIIDLAIFIFLIMSFYGG